MKRTVVIISPVCFALLLGVAGCSTAHKTGPADSQVSSRMVEPVAPTAPAKAPVATPRPTSDSETLQGKWEGEEIGNNPGPCHLVISGKDLEFHAADPNEWYKGTFSLREDTNPRQVILVITGCSADQYIGKTTYAIYRLEGSTLTIAGNEPGNPEVPAAFDAPDARRFVLKSK